MPTFISSFPTFRFLVPFLVPSSQFHYFPISLVCLHLMLALVFSVLPWLSLVSPSILTSLPPSQSCRSFYFPFSNFYIFSLSSFSLYFCCITLLLLSWVAIAHPLPVIHNEEYLRCKKKLAGYYKQNKLMQIPLYFS